MTRSGPPFRRILIANRGEIALRVIRTCRELGTEVVAVYSDADSGAAHVRLADASVRLGAAPATESYLRSDAVIEAALATGAEAIHPGYGFLAESAAFARAVDAAGLVFVGPPANAIAALGNKLSARQAALAAGVPVVPGTLDAAPVERPDQVQAIMDEAKRVGFPLLVKAAAGGGGKGMRRVSTAAELPAALAAGSREATASFGDGSVYLEREIRPARHIEVQLLGDNAGTVVALGERDCSVQRRHQKLVEEAPAPGLTERQRADLHDMAVRVARAAGLANAATAEFLYDRDGGFWFLEVNTRLQVEHGVTELVTGLDIVREQLHLAAGDPVSVEARAAADRAARPTSHAIEVRLSAEDPARSFAPAPGRVGLWRMPSGPGVRVDSAVEPGDRVPPEYDPLIAKLMVVASDRPSAIARLARALGEVEITGIQTTLPFDRFLVSHPAFGAADLSTDWADTLWDGATERAAARHVAQLAAGLAVLASPPGETPETSGGPASRTDPEASRGDAAWRQAGREAAIDRWPG